MPLIQAAAAADIGMTPAICPCTDYMPTQLLQELNFCFNRLS